MRSQRNAHSGRIYGGLDDGELHQQVGLAVGFAGPLSFSLSDCYRALNLAWPKTAAGPIATFGRRNLRTAISLNRKFSASCRVTDHGRTPPFKVRAFQHKHQAT
jgi:hypothetical protein